MESLRRLVWRPRVDDWSPLAQLYYADEGLNAVAAELDAIDGRKEPERCNDLMARLRQAQDRLLQIIEEICVLIWPEASDRAPRDFRAKFPDDILQDNLPGQLWFGAECLAAGSNIIEREAESEAIRPLARSLTRHLDRLREALREQSLRNPNLYPEKVRKQLRVFDHLFAEFELNYVSAMVPVKSLKEYNALQDVAVLFSETLERAIRLSLITEEQIEDCDPSVMLTLPRLAIIAGLLIYPEGPLSTQRPPEEMSEIFRPFRDFLRKIRNLLDILTEVELSKLERSLANQEELPVPVPVTESSKDMAAFDPARQRDESGADLASSLPDSTARPRLDSESEKILLPPGAGLIGESETLKAKTRREALRSNFASSEDLVHRLFVCVALVADQLQTNYPADVRAVLKKVLAPVEPIPVYEVAGKASAQETREEELAAEAVEERRRGSVAGGGDERVGAGAGSGAGPGQGGQQQPPPWVPDADATVCAACSTAFTFVRRRHHCRNCGNIFCARCSANSLPLPEHGYDPDRPVRVCNQCFLFKLNPFTPSSAVAAATASH